MDSYIKRMGSLWEILTRSSKRYQDPVLWAWLLIFLTPLLYLKCSDESVNCQMSPVVFFCAFYNGESSLSNE